MEKVQKTQEEIAEMVAERNERLKVFLKTNLPKSYIIGNESSPAIILGKQVLSAYVKNFNLVLMDSPEKGKEVHRLRIRKNMKPEDKEIFDNWLKTAEHRAIYKIHVKNTNLYLAGYNYVEKEREETKFPVFAANKMKIYFNLEYATSLVNLYKEEYNVEIE